MSIENFISNCHFYDYINFRHGFGREGILTTRETEILTSCGYIIKQLELGTLIPQSEAQRDMLLVLNNQAEPKTEVENTWMKYCEHLNKSIKKQSSVLSHVEDQPFYSQSV